MEEHGKECPMLNFHKILEKLLVNPDVDPKVVSKLVDMNEAAMARRAKVEYNIAMVRAQSLMPIVPEDKKNSQTHSSYSAYKTILKYTKPIYTDAGFALVFSEGETDKPGNIRICVNILHVGGHSETRWTDVPIDDKGIQGRTNKTNTHAKGSSNSYGKSYLIKMIFNIPTGGDDDGNAAGGSVTATDGHIKIIKTLIVKSKLSAADFKKRLVKKYMTEKIEQLTLADAEDLIRNLKLMEK